jgi:hypothetical protein
MKVQWNNGIDSANWLEDFEKGAFYRTSFLCFFSWLQKASFISNPGWTKFLLVIKYFQLLLYYSLIEQFENQTRPTHKSCVLSWYDTLDDVFKADTIHTLLQKHTPWSTAFVTKIRSTQFGGHLICQPYVNC